MMEFENGALQIDTTIIDFLPPPLARQINGLEGKKVTEGMCDGNPGARQQSWCIASPLRRIDM